jgi:transcriptional regulator with XRE-family HTH domain
MASQSSDQKLFALGERLRRIRELSGQSRTQFANRIGISVSTLKRMETGMSGLTIGRWAAVLDALARLDDLDSILDDQGPNSPFQHQTHAKPLRRLK